MFQKSLPTLNVSFVHVRRVLARRPWLYWLAVTLVALAVGASVAQRAAGVDAERASWGETVSLAVAATDLAPGDALDISYVEVPAAAVPSGTAGELTGVARQHVAAGEPLMHIDVAPAGGPQALIPTGWLATPIAEAPAVGAAAGDRVVVTADGFVVADDAIVVAADVDATLVATPADVAPNVAAVARGRTVTLLLRP